MALTDSYRSDSRGVHIIAGQRYKHFKGAVYEIVGVATHTETEEGMVIYRDVQTERMFARPLSSFLRAAVLDEEEVPRFVLIERGRE
jgi:hypothetical protein